MNVPDSHATERAGVLEVGAIFNRLKWIFREQPTSDFGIDAHVEVVTDHTSRGRLLALQIKSGPSYFETQSPDTITYYVDHKHLDYWLGHSLPVLVILYDPVGEVAYWEHVTRDNVRETRKGWKLLVPKSQVLDETWTSELRELAEATPAELRLRRLQIALDPT